MDDTLLLCAIAASGVAVLCWVLSLVTGEHSWVDRLWSVLPPAYLWWFAYRGDFDPRTTTMAVLGTAWGVRLTYNFARKGGYAPGGEDYRWAILRERMHPALYAVFNVVFICLFQHALLLAITSPAWLTQARAGTPLGPLDLLAAGLFVVFLVGETVADQQQWEFQQDKQARRERGETIERQFLATGLFRYSRHPNFFCEQGMWWAMYLFSAAAGAAWLNPTILGAATLTALFHGSTGFTESITRSRYPEYATYQSTTSRLIPWPPRRRDQTAELNA